MGSKIVSKRVSAFVLIALMAWLFTGCGGGKTPPPPPPSPVDVSVSASSNIAQAGTTVQLTASALNTNVRWDVNGVAGGNAALGTVSATGVYTAPESVLDTTDIRVTATSTADTSKSASATIAVFAAPLMRWSTHSHTFFEEGQYRLLFPRIMGELEILRI
jgi:hypothetical protein